MSESDYLAVAKNRADYIIRGGRVNLDTAMMEVIGYSLLAIAETMNRLNENGLSVFLPTMPTLDEGDE